MYHPFKCNMRPVGQAVKTAASHAANMGSIPVRVTNLLKTTQVVYIFLDYMWYNTIYKVGAYCREGPPVPIPNTEVKLISAENTWLEAAWKDRSMPSLIYSSIAQSVEHAAVNRRVVGSSPTWGAKTKNTHQGVFCFARKLCTKPRACG